MDEFGVIFRLDWNSNGWEDKPTSEDIINSKFDYVREKEESYTYFNFNKSELIYNNLKYALIPQITTKTPQKKPKVCFLISQKDDETYLVGYIISPEFGVNKHFEYISNSIKFNVRSHPDNFIKITPVMINVQDYIPKNKGVGTRGYNYISKNNCKDLFKLAHGNTLSSKILALIR